MIVNQASKVINIVKELLISNTASTTDFMASISTKSYGRSEPHQMLSRALFPSSPLQNYNNVNK